MKARTARLGVLLAAVFGLMATMIPSASATTVKTVTFEGTANLSSGLGYPCAPATTTDPLAKCPGVPDPGPPLVVTGGNHVNFSFTSNNCVKVSASVNKTPDKTGPAFCQIQATGTVWGFCGLSSAVGTATLVNTGPVVPGAPGGNKESTSANFTFVGVGGLLVVTGTEKGGNATLTAEVAAVPAVNLPGGPSCTDKTATTFTLVGEATVVDPT